MAKKLTLLVFVTALIFMLVLTTVSAQAQSEEERLRLIRASQQLLEAEEEEIFSNKFGVFVTTYGTRGTAVNPGARLEIVLPVIQQLSFMMEGIYFQATGSGAGFVSLKAAPLAGRNISPYLGVGGEVTDQAEYQLFAGLEISDSLFLEAKYINEAGDFEDSEFSFATGYQLSF